MGTGTRDDAEPRPVLTFDLFSALLDSRRGGARTFASIGTGRGWSADGAKVYDRWDALNKAAQRDCDGWVPFAELARQALATAYAELGLEGDPARDVGVLLASMTDWPLWPDVPAALPAWTTGSDVAGHRVGLLSNVDDALFRSTRAAAYVDPDVAMTSERLRAYKPGARIYTGARERLGTMLHVATSARDVRGALEAGCPVIRLRRPGHHLDPAGPEPPYEVDDLAELPALVARITAR